MTTDSEPQCGESDSHWVVPVEFSPNGKWIATGSGDQTAKVWDAETGELRRTITGHTEKVGCVRFSPDGKTLATADDNKAIKLWDVRSLVARK